MADAAPSLEDGAGAAAAMGGGAAEADATGPFARPAADATTGLPFPDLPLGRGSRYPLNSIYARATAAFPTSTLDSCRLG